MEKNSAVKRVNKADSSVFKLNIKDLVAYKDLIYMFVKRYYATMYKQTVLGPFWVVLNPLLTSLMFAVVFGNIANFSTGEVPGFVFYLAGNTLWILFSFNLTTIASTFTTNRDIFGKVYFPRMTMPISVIISGFINYIVQFCVFLVVYLIYLFSGSAMSPSIYLLFVPLIIFLVVILGTGVGLIVTALTTRYKDLHMLVGFAVQLWMFLTPIIYPISAVDGLAKTAIMLNPMSSLSEAFRFAFTGVGEWDWLFLGISTFLCILSLVVGVLLFNRAEKTFVDTV